MKQLLKIAGISGAGILILLALLLVLLSFGIFNPYISKTVLKIANQQLNDSIKIGKIDGNILSHFIVKDLQINQKNTKVISIEEMEINYNIWKIAGKKIKANFIELKGVQVFLKEETDGLWNLQKLVPDKELTTSDSISPSFNWKIEFADIQIKNFEATIAPNDTLLLMPRTVKLDAGFTFSYAENFMETNMLNLSLTTLKPALQMTDLKFQARYSDSVFSWDKFELTLENSNILSNGSLPINQPHFSEIDLTASPFDFCDIQEWFPYLHGSPEIKLLVKNEGDNSKIDFKLSHDSQSLNITGNLWDLSTLPTYRFVIETDSINGEYWTHDPELKSNINGKFELDGQGFDFVENTLNANAQFVDIKYDGYELTDFLLSLEKNKNQLDGNIKTTTIFGELESQFHIKNLFKLPEYNANLQLKHFNLAKLTFNKNLTSNINVEIKAKGQGFEPGNMQTNIWLKSNNSVFLNQPITDFNTHISLNKTEYQIEGFHLETPYLLAKISGEGNITDNNRLNFNLITSNIEKTAQALGFEPIFFDGQIEGNLTGPLTAIKINSNLTIHNFSTDSVEINNTEATIQSRFSISRTSAETDSMQENNSISIIDFKTLYLKTEANIGFITFEDYYLDNGTFDFEKNGENLKGKLISNTLFGELNTKINIGNMFSIPDYDLIATLKNSDLSKITGNPTFPSNINLEISAKGKGIKLKTLKTEIKIQSEKSSIFDLPIEDFEAKINYIQGKYLLHGFRLKTPFMEASASGEGNWDKNNKINFDIKIKDDEKITSALGYNNLKFKGAINGHLSGPADSLRIKAGLDLEQLKYDTFSVNKLIADAYIQYAGSAYFGLLNIQLNDTRIQDFDLKELKLKSRFDQEKSNNSFTFFASDSLNGRMLTKVLFTDNPTLYIPDIELNLYNNHWIGGSNSSFIKFKNDSIEINEINITSEKSALKAHGNIAFHGTENLHVELLNLDLISIPGLQLLPYQLSGTVNALFDLKGTAKNPILKGFLNIDQPKIEDMAFNKFYVNIDYSHENMELNSYLNDSTTRLISADLNLPLHLSFTDNIYLPQKDNPINAKIKIDQLNLSTYNRFLPLKGAEIKGKIDFQMDIGNTINDPEIKGSMALQNGSFSYKKLGINYKNIELSSHLNNNIFLMDSLMIFSGKGNFKMKGLAEIESFVDGKLKNINFDLSGQNFRAFDSELLKAVFNTNLTVKGTPEKPIFSGNLMVLRSTFNTDLFLKEYNRVYDISEQPLLLVARENAKKNEFLQVLKMDTIGKPPPDIYKNLTGQFDIEIPRNTWVKGKNMNFELSGTIKAIKEGEQIDFFGTMNVNRGFYRIYGRRLEFEEGQVTFTGGPSLNPTLNFKIAYKFRDQDSQLRKLTGNITGRVSKPEIVFSLDDISIEEKDAISYLLFNKNINQLDTREVASVKSSNLSIAKDLAIGQFSNVVKDALQSSLGLDVIEISGKSGWTQSSVSIGKYITNDLFLSYERTFALDKKDKIIEPEKITLEYQFYRSLFLQATNQSSNSGFDFILKWTWK